MSLQNLMHRRKFIERSMLGFSSAFILPSLLQSCIKDHDIPDPEGPTIPPLGEANDDWNEQVKILITTGLSFIPEGELLVGLLDLVWPSSGNSPWDNVKSQVESLVDKKLAKSDYDRVKADLQGLRNVVADYKEQIKDNADIKGFWIAAYTEFDQRQPSFQQEDDEVLLLPLFVQFANMYLALLRDAVLHGAGWGLTLGELSTYATKCQNKITEFKDYTRKWYLSGRAPLQNKTRDDKTLEPFRSTNAYDRTMTMLVLDYMDSWKYYDWTWYPNGAKNGDGTPIPLFTREIYSDPIGNRINVDRVMPAFALPTPATAFPTHITVWGGSRIDAVQLTYPEGGGPNGATTTPRMGDQNGGSIKGSFDIDPTIPISSVLMTWGYVNSGPLATSAIDSLQFVGVNAQGGTAVMGKEGEYKTGNIGYGYYALSSIYIDGVNETLQNSANCIVFGFKRWPIG